MCANKTSEIKLDFYFYFSAKLTQNDQGLFVHFSAFPIKIETFRGISTTEKTIFFPVALHYKSNIII